MLAYFDKDKEIEMQVDSSENWFRSSFASVLFRTKPRNQRETLLQHDDVEKKNK